MEEVEYLEEYEDIVLPKISSDDGSYANEFMFEHSGDVLLSCDPDGSLLPVRDDDFPSEFAFGDQEPQPPRRAVAAASTAVGGEGDHDLENSMDAFDDSNLGLASSLVDSKKRNTESAKSSFDEKYTDFTLNRLIHIANDNIYDRESTSKTSTATKQKVTETAPKATSSTLLKSTTQRNIVTKPSPQTQTKETNKCSNALKKAVFQKYPSSGSISDDFSADLTEDDMALLDTYSPFNSSSEDDYFQKEDVKRAKQKTVKPPTKPASQKIVIKSNTLIQPAKKQPMKQFDLKSLPQPKQFDLKSLPMPKRQVELVKPKIVVTENIQEDKPIVKPIPKSFKAPPIKQTKPLPKSIKVPTQPKLSELDPLSQSPQRPTPEKPPKTSQSSFEFFYTGDPLETSFTETPSPLKKIFKTTNEEPLVPMPKKEKVKKKLAKVTEKTKSLEEINSQTKDGTNMPPVESSTQSPDVNAPEDSNKTSPDLVSSRNLQKVTVTEEPSPSSSSTQPLTPPIRKVLQFKRKSLPNFNKSSAPPVKKNIAETQTPVGAASRKINEISTKSSATPPLRKNLPNSSIPSNSTSPMNSADISPPPLLKKVIKVNRSSLPQNKDSLTDSNRDESISSSTSKFSTQSLKRKIQEVRRNSLPQISRSLKLKRISFPEDDSSSTQPLKKNASDGQIDSISSSEGIPDKLASKPALKKLKSKSQLELTARKILEEKANSKTSESNSMVNSNTSGMKNNSKKNMQLKMAIGNKLSSPGNAKGNLNEANLDDVETNKIDVKSKRATAPEVAPAKEVEDNWKTIIKSKRSNKTINEKHIDSVVEADLKEAQAEEMEDSWKTIIKAKRSNKPIKEKHIDNVVEVGLKEAVNKKSNRIAASKVESVLEGVASKESNSAEVQPIPEPKITSVKTTRPRLSNVSADSLETQYRKLCPLNVRVALDRNIVALKLAQMANGASETLQLNNNLKKKGRPRKVIRGRKMAIRMTPSKQLKRLKKISALIAGRNMEKEKTEDKQVNVEEENNIQETAIVENAPNRKNMPSADSGEPLQRRSKKGARLIKLLQEGLKGRRRKENIVQNKTRDNPVLKADSDLPACSIQLKKIGIDKQQDNSITTKEVNEIPHDMQGKPWKPVNRGRKSTRTSNSKHNESLDIKTEIKSPNTSTLEIPPEPPVLEMPPEQPQKKVAPKRPLKSGTVQTPANKKKRVEAVTSSSSVTPKQPVPVQQCVGTIKTTPIPTVQPTRSSINNNLPSSLPAKKTAFIRPSLQGGREINAYEMIDNLLQGAKAREVSKVRQDLRLKHMENSTYSMLTLNTVAQFLEHYMSVKVPETELIFDSSRRVVGYKIQSDDAANSVAPQQSELTIASSQSLATPQPQNIQITNPQSLAITTTTTAAVAPSLVNRRLMRRVNSQGTTPPSTPGTTTVSYRLPKDTLIQKIGTLKRDNNRRSNPSHPKLIASAPSLVHLPVVKPPTKTTPQIVVNHTPIDYETLIAAESAYVQPVAAEVQPSPPAPSHASTPTLVFINAKTRSKTQAPILRPRRQPAECIIPDEIHPTEIKSEDEEPESIIGGN